MTPQYSIRLLNEITSVDQFLNGRDYLRSVIKSLALNLGIKYVFIGHPQANDPTCVETDVVWANGDFADNFIYELENTPCENVLSGRRVCLYENVVGLFPKDELLQKMGVESYVGVPTINRDGKLTGLLVVLHDRPIENKEIVSAMVEFIAVRIQAEIDKSNVEEALQKEVAQRTEELKQANLKLEKAVAELEAHRDVLEVKIQTDGLTGVLSREYFMDLAEQQLKLAKRHHFDVSFLFIDLDYFKEVNDQFGHMVGDDVLREVASRISRCVRDTDLLARFGGDEFVLLSPYSEEHDAVSLANRILKTISDAPTEAHDQLIHQSVSIGVTTSFGQVYSLETLMERADKALYESKQQGRDSYKLFR